MMTFEGQECAMLRIINFHISEDFGRCIIVNLEGGVHISVDEDNPVIGHFKNFTSRGSFFTARYALVSKHGTPERNIEAVGTEAFLRQFYAPPKPVTMDFSNALESLKDGRSICRTGWNGKDQYVHMQRPDEFSKMSEPYAYLVQQSQTENGLKQTVIPWVPSQGDLFAEDWQHYTKGE